MAKKGSLKKFLSIFLRIAISIVLLIFLLRNVDKRTLFSLIKHADKPLLLSACIVFMLGYLLCLLRWAMLLKAAKINLPLKRVLISFSGGIFFNLFLPSTIGGDLVRSLDLAAYTNRPKEVVATVLLDRLSGYVGLAIISFLAALFGFHFVDDKVVIFSLLIIFAILIFILFFLFNGFLFTKINQFLSSFNQGKIISAIKNVHEEMHYFKNYKKLIACNISLSVLIQLLSPLTFLLIGVSLGIRINIIYYLVFIPIIGAITLLPISIGGLGLRDATTIYFFAKASVEKNLSFAMSLINFSFILLFGIIGGIVYVFTVRHRRLQRHQPQSVSP